MLSLYKEIASSRVIDDRTRSEFAIEIRAIERAHGMSPIDNMTESECSNLEYQFIANYTKTLAKIYECYDKMLNLTIPEIQESEVRSVIDKMDYHARSIFLTLANVPSIYSVTPAVVVADYCTKHYLSRYNQLVDMRPTTCCTLL